MKIEKLLQLVCLQLPFCGCFSTGFLHFHFFGLDTRIRNIVTSRVFGCIITFLNMYETLNE